MRLLCFLISILSTECATNGTQLWTRWTSWGNCTGECRKEVQSRSRDCYVTSSANTTADIVQSNATRCENSNTETKTCRSQVCQKEDQLERLLFSIIFACIFFVPAIIIFIVVGCTNQRREDNDLFQRQKAHAREERRVLTKQGGGDATGTANNNVYVPQGRRSSRFTESFVT